MQKPFKFPKQKSYSVNLNIMKNKFLSAVSSHNTTTENGAVSHSTTNSLVLDYFQNCSTFRDRDKNKVYADMSAAYGESPEMALKIMFYNRMITRKSKGFFDSDSVQKGQGNKDEFVKSLEWLQNSHPEVLQENLWLVPVVGSWKDLWYDSPQTGYHFYVDTRMAYELIKKGLADSFNRQLIAKFLPRIKSKSNVKNERHARQNIWALGLCKHLGWSASDYRRFKSNPDNTAHLYQRVMASGLWDKLDFNKIPGKALFNILTLKGKDKQTVIERHGLTDKYITWIKMKPVAPFTGYVYELFLAATKNTSLAQKMTYDAQFEGLLELARKDTGLGLSGNIWCALDTSASMKSIIAGSSVSAYDVCVSLGIYFSSLNEGVFKDHVMMFDATSRMMKLYGTFTDKAKQIKNATTAWGNTNFQSVVDEIVRVRKSNPSIPVEDYPTTLLVVSDMQFDGASSTKTNYEVMMQKLADVGLPKIKVIWWQVTSRTSDVPNKMGDGGVAMLSGFDGSVISMILSGEQEVVDEKTGEKRPLAPYENMVKALNQEALNQICVPI